jgi:hypothetical protein
MHRLRSPYCLEFVYSVSLSKGARQSIWAQEGGKITVRRRVLYNESFRNLHASYYNSFMSMTQQPLAGQGLLIFEASLSHSDTPHSVRHLWTSDQPDAEIYTSQHTTFTRERHPCHQRETKPAIPASVRPQIHAIDRADTGIGHSIILR